jgi:predicted transcriptional regulator
VAKVLEELKKDEWFVKKVKKIIKELKLEKEFKEI